MEIEKIKSLKELGRFLDKNQFLYDVKGNKYNVNDMNFVLVKHDIFGERNLEVKNHHFHIEAIVNPETPEQWQSRVLFDEKGYRQYLRKKAKTARDIQELQSFFENNL